MFDLLLNVHGKQLMSCRDGELLIHDVPGQAYQEQFTSNLLSLLLTVTSKLAEETKRISTKECAG